MGKLLDFFDRFAETLEQISSSLNTCSTGICVLAMSFERYIFICHPTKANDWLSDKNHTIVSVFSSILVLLGLIMNLTRVKLEEKIQASMGIKYWEDRDNTINGIEVTIFLKAVDVLLFFIAPVLICIVLFLKIARALKKMMTHQRRNQQITRALAFSYETSFPFPDSFQILNGLVFFEKNDAK